MIRLTARHYLAIALIAFATLLPGRASLPPLDRDEPRYMEATAQMLTSHDFVDVRFLDQPRYLQPAGIYWLEAVSVAVLKGGPVRTAWPYRVPSLIAATLAITLTAWLGASLFGARAGLLAAGLLDASTLLTAEGRMATIDSALLLAVMVVQIALWRAYRDGRAWKTTPIGWALAYWIGMGCGMMLKGPVILIPGLLTPLMLWAWDRDRRWWHNLRPAWGWLLALAVVLPWCIAIDVVSHGTFFSRAVGTNFLGKIGHGQQAHGSPPGFHLLVFAIAFWPGAAFAAWAAPAVWTRRDRPEVRFLLSWIVPHWLVFELIATKLPHYVLPTYPAIAILTAAALCTWPWQVARQRWARLLIGVYLAVGAVAGLAFCVAGPVLLWRIEHIMSPRALLAVVGAVPLVVAAFWLWRQREGERAAWSAIAAAVVIHTGLFVAVIPRLQTIWLAPRIATMFANFKPCPNSTLVSTSFSEPSLVFLVGQGTHLLGPAAAAIYLGAHSQCALALVDRRDGPAFSAAMARQHLMPVEYGRIVGVNYSNGHKLDLGLYAPVAQ
jgi:4-amino-4-deoxy-L-arabinose transferase-like glycosyltransferase